MFYRERRESFERREKKREKGEVEMKKLTLTLFYTLS